MAETLLDFKANKRRRLPVTKVSVQELVPVVEEPTLVDRAVPELSILSQMSRKNPHLTDLIAALDLVEVSSGPLIEAETDELDDFFIVALKTEEQHSVQNIDAVGNQAVRRAVDALLPPPVTAQFNPERLKSIALKAFAPNNGYTKDEAAALLSKQTGVSVERATNGLILMVEHQILSLTPHSIYYLFESTPF